MKKTSLRKLRPSAAYADATPIKDSFRAYPMFESLISINEVVSFFAIAGAMIQVIFFFNFFYSMYRGPKSPRNPWKSNTLEWTAPVEHMHGNWPGKIPTVHRWAYDYSKPGKKEDYVPQDIPLSKGEKDH